MWMANKKASWNQLASACRKKCLHAGRGWEISSDFAKMNSSAYVCTLEFIFAKSAQASRISKIGLPVAFYSYKLNFKI